MRISNRYRLPAILATTLLLNACGGNYYSSRDRAPSRPLDVSRVPDAVPKAEPLSRSGNPTSYVVFGKRYYPMKSSAGFSERGIASWYGTKFHGRDTSSGERYNMYAMTAAHKTLPLPTYVEVKNLKNGRSVVVKVNDRGPFHGNRVIDLSYAAASKLDILGKGTGLVEVRAIDPSAPNTRYASAPVRDGASTRAPAARPQVPSRAGSNAPVATPLERAPTPVATATPLNEPDLFLQVGAFTSRTNAERLRASLTDSKLGAVNISEFAGIDGPVFRVRIGPLASVEEADRMVESLGRYGIDSPRVVID